MRLPEREETVRDGARQPRRVYGSEGLGFESLQARQTQNAGRSHLTCCLVFPRPQTRPGPKPAHLLVPRTGHPRPPSPPARSEIHLPVGVHRHLHPRVPRDLHRSPGGGAQGSRRTILFDDRERRPRPTRRARRPRTSHSATPALEPKHDSRHPLTGHSRDEFASRNYFSAPAQAREQGRRVGGASRAPRQLRVARLGSRLACRRRQPPDKRLDRAPTRSLRRSFSNCTPDNSGESSDPPQHSLQSRPWDGQVELPPAEILHCGVRCLHVRCQAKARSSPVAG